MAIAKRLLEAGAQMEGPDKLKSSLFLCIKNGLRDLLPVFQQRGVDLQGPMSAGFPEAPAAWAARENDGDTLLRLRTLGIPLGVSQESSYRLERLILELWCDRATAEDRTETWWQTFDFLLAEPFFATRDLRVALWAAGVENKDGFRDEIIGRLQRSSWWTPSMAVLMFDAFVARKDYEAANALLSNSPCGVPLSMGIQRTHPLAPSPSLASFLRHTIGLHKRPRLLKKANQRVAQVLDLGASPNEPEDLMPLFHWAVSKKLPHSTLDLLVKHGTNPTELQFSVDIENHSLKLWASSTVAHRTAWDAEPEWLDYLFSRFPALVHTTDDQGLTPLHRLVVPPFTSAFCKNNSRNLTPSLKVLLFHGADITATSSSGKNLLHLVAIAAEYLIFPADLGDFLAIVFRMEPELFLQESEGRSAIDWLNSNPTLQANPVLKAISQGILLDGKLESEALPSLTPKVRL